MFSLGGWCRNSLRGHRFRGIKATVANSAVVWVGFSANFVFGFLRIGSVAGTMAESGGNVPISELVQLRGEPGKGETRLLDGAERRLFELLGLSIDEDTVSEPTGSSSASDSRVPTQPAALGLSNIPVKLPSLVNNDDSEKRAKQIDQILSDMQRLKPSANKLLDSLELPVMGEPQFVIPHSQELVELNTTLSSTSIAFETNDADTLNKFAFAQFKGTNLDDMVESVAAHRAADQDDTVPENKLFDAIMDGELERVAPGVSGGLAPDDFVVKEYMVVEPDDESDGCADAAESAEVNTEPNTSEPSALKKAIQDTRVAQDPELAEKLREDVLRRRNLRDAGYDESVADAEGSSGRKAEDTGAPSVNITSIFDFTFSDDDDSSSSDEEEQDTESVSHSAAPAATIDVSTTDDNTDASNGNAVVDDAVLGTSFVATGASSVLDKTSKHVSSARDGELSYAITDNVDVSRFHELVPEMAWKFPFELDTFQKEAVLHLERGESVFVAAHTSAGKTVVAEYAIALCKHHMTKCVYTSPIKALSNQKYRDFQERFEDIGLITGDTQIKPEASCLIMTTEILRSMLYRGSDLIRDIEWVIFDEVHYINDAERGVVWEEVIIMLPEHVNLVFLSATTPNTAEFSDWIGRTKQRQVYVISTAHRPVPLTHYLYTGVNGKDKLHQIVNDKGQFDALGYKKASQLPPSKAAKAVAKRPTGRGGGGSKRGGKSASHKRGGKGGGGKGGATIKSFIQLIKQKELLPMVVFAFSKRKCESNAHGLQGLSLNTKSEQSHVTSFCRKALSRLRGTDRDLPQVRVVVDQAKRGVGVHHGGLLPILKEIVEILFCEGLIKVLFATETFAMGVNAPAKAVAFASVRKFDGNGFRTLLPGEYTQMSGRAGRRGLDTTGTVVILAINDDIPERDDLAKMLTGRPTALESQFRLTFTMILNLLKVEDMSVEGMIKKSFSEVHTARALKVKDPDEFLAKLEASRARLPPVENESDAEIAQAIVDVESKLESARQSLHSKVIRNTKVFASGRVVVLRPPRELAALIPKAHAASQTGTGYVPGAGETLLAILLGPATARVRLLVLCPKPLDHALSRANASEHGYTTQRSSSSGRLGLLLETPIANIELVCAASTKRAINRRVYQAPEECGVEFSRALDKLVEVEGTCGNYPEPGPGSRQPKELNFGSCVGKQVSLELGVAIREVKTFSDELESILTSDIVVNTPTARISQAVAVETKRLALDSRIHALKTLFSSEALRLFPDFQQRLKVLVKLDYINAEHAVQLKGRIASEINTCDELVLTELVSENLLCDLDAAQCVALLSALIFKKKTDDDPYDGLPDLLKDAIDDTKDIAKGLAAIQLDCGLEILEDEFVKETLNFGLVRVVYEWARGMPFSDICMLTSVEEGTVVRAITRVDETCREVRNAARIIGDPSLYRKMEMASEMIKRDIVFATSLYLS